MSYFEKNSYPSSYSDQPDSSEQESPRRLKVALKHVQTDACKCHHNDKTKTSNKNQLNGSTSNTKTVADAKNLSNDGTERQAKKSEIGYDAEFHPYCRCEECLQYREVLIQLVLEDHEYNTLWDRLQALIREFYDIIPQNSKPYEGSMDERYEELMKSQARWFTDGHIDQQKNIQLSLSSQLPLSNEMTFVLVFSMLCSRDSHQLLELLCIQLRCIAIAYSDGMKKLIKTNENGKNPTYNPVELLTFILDGYDKLCNTAKKLSSLLFELQRDHLQHFELTWTILNKRMYQRYVYMEIQELIPECILKLKDLLEPEKYSTMAHRLIRFDEDMTSITKTWAEVWTLLQTFHMTDMETERRNRMGLIEGLFKEIRKSDFDFLPHEILLNREHSSKMQWTKLENRDDAWTLAVHYLKNVWNEKDDTRLYSMIQNERCITCYSPLTSHYADCDCMTCLFAGGPCNTQAKGSLDKYYCTRCSFYEKLDRDYVDYIKKDLTRKLQETIDKKKPLSLLSLDLDDEYILSDGDLNDFMLTNHCYHLSWAVFKHLPNRKPYNVPNFDAQHFCSFQDPPCMRNECRVATHIVAGLYPLNFSKFLIKAYQPLKEDERTELMNIQKLYFSYLMQKVSNDKIPKVDMLSQMDLLWNVDDAEYTLFCDIGSAFAECYLIDMAIPVQELLDSCFIVDNNDIELNMYWLECIYMFKESDNSPLKKIENNPKVLEFQLRMQMDQVGSGNDVTKFTAATTRVLATTSERRQQMKNKKGESSSISNSSSSMDRIVSISTKTTTTTTTSKKDITTKLDMDHKEKSKIKPETYERLMQLLDHMKKEPKKSDNNDDEPKECLHNKVKVVITRKKTAENNTTTQSPCRDIKYACDKDNPNENDVTLADAVKIAVKQQLNQKLEAELKSLKKEHSVLKDMVRDLENDENQLISKKEKVTGSSNGNHHCCSEHSDMLESHANHPKMCHRGDGQCTCYYCTIFGHAECNHGRSNETRDRLRKRLHQIHSKSSTKSHTTKSMKNQPGALKKMLAGKVTTANDPAVNHNKKQSLLLCNQPVATKPPTEQKENNTNEKIEAALQENWSKLDDTKSSCSKSATNNIPTVHTVASSSDPKNAKKRKLLNAIKPDYVNLYECEVETCESCCGENKTQPTASSKSMVEQLQGLAEEPTSMDSRNKISQVFTDESASLDDILDFIEGNSTAKKDSQKKAAKKAKQKQKKEDVKRLEELEQLRDQFHEVFFKESDVKNELKNLRSMKKRDKKKIAELETSIKKYGKFKCKIESNILELIVALKANSPEFKFAYLPSKELLEKQSTQNNGTPLIAASAEQAKIQTEKSNNVRIIQNDQRHGDSQQQQQQQPQQTCELSLDQSKRMVTIRRINIPHAEPQVTVTAKGISPDKDKLLYTFINGQLIPSANVPNASSSNQSGSNEKLDKTSKTKQTPKAATETAPNSTKSNKKQTESQNVIEKTAKKNIKDKPTEKAKPTDKSTGRKSPPDNVKPSTNLEQNGKKSTTSANNKAAKTTANNAVKEKDKQKKKGKKDEDVENVTELTKNLTLSEEQPKKQKKKVKAIKYEYADPNYKVNQFNLLDTDEDGDDYYLESSSDESIDEPVPVKLSATVSQTPTASVQVSTIDSQASQQSKNNNKNKGKDKNAKNQLDKAKKAKNDANSNAKTTNTTTTTTTVTKTDKKPSPSESNKMAAKPSNVVTPKPASVETVTLKKQKKKAQKQQNQTQVQAQLQPHQPTLVRSKSSVEKPTPKGDNAVNSLNKSMQRMHLNSDTTIEPVNNSNHTANKNSLNVSIMDQLSRGVKVEGLTLPPGITLTRVDPSKADNLRANKESINRISHPAPLQYQQPTEYQRPPSFINPGIQMQPNGMIMVDPMQNISTATVSNAAAVAAATAPDSQQTGSKKNRKNKKKNKIKNETENANDQAQAQQSEPKIVTLRNPLFQPAGDAANLQRSVPLQQQNQMPMNINQPASIIKNENGMFTIRNMALHQALSNGVAPGYRPYPNEMYQQPEPKTENYSYFSGNSSTSATDLPSSNIVTSEMPSTTNAKPTPHLAIGSEMKKGKSAQQMNNSPWYPSVTQQQTYGSMNGDIFNNMTHLNPKRSYSPFDVSPNFGFNSDFIGLAQTPTVPQPSTSMHSQYFNGGFPFNNQTQSDGGSLFSSRTSSTLTNNAHCCDDIPPTQDESSFFKKLEDETFLHGLHAGQRLNSEVTIHNINDSKFNRKSMSIGLHDGVEITRINGPDNYTANPNLAVGSQRPTSANDDLNNGTNSEFSDNVFKPNAAVNLNELESEERDIETFKRFNYYFNPPKNKPKINFDVKGIVVAKKQPASENSSPYFGELAGSCNTPHPDDEFYPELNSFKPINCDPIVKPQTTVNRIHSDNFLHGIIGQELKNDKD